MNKTLLLLITISTGFCFYNNAFGFYDTHKGAGYLLTVDDEDDDGDMLTSVCEDCECVCHENSYDDCTDPDCGCECHEDE